MMHLQFSMKTGHWRNWPASKLGNGATGRWQNWAMEQMALFKLGNGATGHWLNWAMVASKTR